MTVLLLLIVLAGVATSKDHNEKTPLYFSFISSIKPNVGFSAAGGIPAVDIALDIINNRNDILANYSLQYTEILDSKVHHVHYIDLAVYQ